MTAPDAGAVAAQPQPAPGYDETCVLCQLQRAMGRIMNEIEKLPEIGAFYDDKITEVFNAADDAWRLLRHEHGEGGAS